MLPVEQKETAFQKQHMVFRGYKELRKAQWKIDKWGVGKKKRYWKNIGLGFKTAKLQRTIIVRRDYLHFVRKYQRFEKRHTNIPAHLPPCFRVRPGDKVTIGQCRPLSKTIRFCVIRVDKTSSGSNRDQFAGF